MCHHLDKVAKILIYTYKTRIAKQNEELEKFSKFSKYPQDTQKVSLIQSNVLDQ